MKIFLIVGLVWLFLSACATGLSPTGRNQFITVSDSEMEQLGQKAFKEMKSKMRIERSSKINQYVQCVAQQIIQAAQTQLPPNQWEIIVFKENSANAFALPGGKIGVHTGLLKVATTPDQLASVLGHEVGHIIARHSAERMSRAMATQGALAIADIFLKNSRQRGLVMASLGLGAQFGVAMPHGRAQESESDEIGILLMARAGFQPYGSVELWQNMARGSRGAQPEFLSTHPSHSTRIDDLNAKMPEANGIYQQAKSQGIGTSCGSI